MKKRIFSALLAALMLTGMTTPSLADTGDSWDGRADTSWYDESVDKFTLTTAGELAGLAELVDDGNSFDGKTVILGNDIDLYYLTGDEPGSFDPIGDKSAFEGTFDGDGYTIYNLYQSGWEFGYEWGSYGSIGLFGELKDATVKNLTISGAEAFVEGGDVGGITGSATGTCTFENITITDSVFATFNNGLGGIIGWSGDGTYTFKNINIENSVTLAGLWGSFDSSIGGVVGQGEPGATYVFDGVDIACRLDVYNDCTASYDYYLYRMCGMIIGRLEETTTIDDQKYPDMSKYNITCNNVNVTYGDWANYHYCEPTPGLNGGRGMRVEPGYAYDGLPADYDHSQCVDNCMNLIPFDSLFGGDQLGVRGLTTYDGVTIKNSSDEYTIRYTWVVDGEKQEKYVHGLTYGGEVTLSTDAFKRAGYTISGWTNKGEEPFVAGETYDVADIEATDSNKNDDTLTLYVVWTPKTIDLRYIGGVNGDYGYTTDGNWWEVEKVTNDTTSDLKAYTFEREGYEFDGWMDKNGNDAEDPYTVSDTDDNGVERIWAKWKMIDYTVVFYDPTNGSAPATGSATVNIDNLNVTLPDVDDVSKDNHVLYRWYYNGRNYKPGETITVDIATANDDNEIKIGAVWGHEVTFKYNNAVVDTQIVKPGQTVTEPEIKDVQNGFYINGWRLENGNKLYDFANTPVNDNITLVARPAYNTYAITFDTDGGSKVDNIIAKYTSEISAPDAPTKAGYTFAGWVDADGNSVKFPFNMPANDVELKAVWTIDTYTITLDLAGGEYNGATSWDVVYNDTYSIPGSDEVSKPGAALLGWNLDYNGVDYYYADGHTLENLRYTATDNVTFTAIWDTNTYTVTYTDGVNNKVIFRDQAYTVAYGDETPSFEGTPERRGYEFDGWTPAVSATVTADVVYTATWVKAEKENSFSLPKLYELSFDVNGGEKMKSLPRAFGSTVNLKEFIPEREGYTFTGWYADQALTEEITKVVMTSNRTVYAGWEEN